MDTCSAWSPGNDAKRQRWRGLQADSVPRTPPDIDLWSAAMVINTSGRAHHRRVLVHDCRVIEKLKAKLSVVFSQSLSVFPTLALPREHALLILRTVFAFVAPMFLIACGGGSGGQTDSAAPVIPPSIAAADVTILFMGNSHTSNNDIPGTVAALVRAGRPERTVVATQAPGSMHLDERAEDPATLALLQSQRWNYVVLQAQNYSLSGDFFYPTTGAEKLVRMSRQAGALPVLFAEWPRVGIVETQIIYSKYVSVAMKEPACVSPIPQAFDLSRARFPAMTLHAADGNHSAPAGAFLASLILYATITGQPPGDLPGMSVLGIDLDTQTKLRSIATETVQSVAPRLWCPADLQG